MNPMTVQARLPAPATVQNRPYLHLRTKTNSKKMRIIVALLMVILSTAGAYRQAQLKRFFEVFEFETFSFGSAAKDSGDDCLGAPYLYVTGHQETSSVSKYTRDGCFISDNVLVGGPDSDMFFRSMFFNKDGEMLIANAAVHSSSILLYGTCKAGSADNQTKNFQHVPDSKMDQEGPALSEGQRLYKGIITDDRTNPAAVHPYGITLDADQATPPPPARSRITSIIAYT
jgi:hypothetical protein